MTINIIDTPGHADFGGEVERGLSMVDGIVLLVDASEGPLPQTRFVLRKALNADMPVVLVVNKVDRSDARIAEVVDETYELFMDLLDESHSQDALDFPVVYASAKAGRASASRSPTTAGCPTPPTSSRCSAPSSRRSPRRRTTRARRCRPTSPTSTPRRSSAGWRCCGSTRARCARARPSRGSGATAPSKNVRVTELLVTEGLERKPGERAGPGDIVAIAGIPDITIGETLADPEDPRPLPLIHVDEPAISMTIGTNTSPLVGRVKGAQGDRPPGQGPARRRAGRQRLAADPPDRASRRLGGAGPRRAGAGDPGRADAPRGLRADRRQAAGGHPRGRRQGPRAGRAADDRRARRSTSARSPSCSPPARAGWSR